MIKGEIKMNKDKIYRKAEAFILAGADRIGASKVIVINKEDMLNGWNNY